MENKLELKHLAPYLSHGLKVIMEGKKTNVAWISTKNIAVIRPGGIGEIKKIKWEHAGINTKPILRPLSDLTKEIHHKGEKFVPIEIIGKLFVEHGEFEDGLFGWGIPTGGDDYQDYYFNIAFSNDVLHLETWSGEPNESHSYIVETHALEYTLFFQLIEWNFDVFGLIDKGLAVPLT